MAFATRMFKSVVVLFDKSLLQNLIAGLAVFTLGIPAGLWTSEWLASTQQEGDRVKLVDAYLKVLQRNAEQITSVMQVQDLHGIIELSLELTFYESTASKKYDLLDIGLCESIDETYYELLRFDRKIKGLANLLLANDIPPSKQGPYSFGYLQGAMLGHRGIVMSKIDTTKHLLETFKSHH